MGHVYVDVNHEFLSRESHGFLNTLLYITGIGGLLTVGVGILLGCLAIEAHHRNLSAALTRATLAISQGRGDAIYQSHRRTSWGR